MSVGRDTMNDQFIGTVESGARHISTVLKYRVLEERIAVLSKRREIVCRDIRLIDEIPAPAIGDLKVDLVSLPSDYDWDCLAYFLRDRFLKPLDPHTLALFNDRHPSFCEKHPNGTQWNCGGKMTSFVFRQGKLHISTLYALWPKGMWIGATRI